MWCVWSKSTTLSRHASASSRQLWKSAWTTGCDTYGRAVELRSIPTMSPCSSSLSCRVRGASSSILSFLGGRRHRAERQRCCGWSAMAGAGQRRCPLWGARAGQVQGLHRGPTTRGLALVAEASGLDGVRAARSSGGRPEGAVGGRTLTVATVPPWRASLSGPREVPVPSTDDSSYVPRRLAALPTN